MPGHIWIDPVQAAPLCTTSKLLRRHAGVLLVASATALTAATLGGLRLSALRTRAAAALGVATVVNRSRHGGLGSDEGGRCRHLMHEGKEGGKWLAPPKVKTNVGEALIEASDEVEDEGPIRDNLAEGAKIGGHPLETPAVIRNGHITLGEATELGVEVEGLRLTVAEELCFHGKPGVACGDGARGDGVGKVIGDGLTIQDFTTQSMRTQSG